MAVRRGGPRLARFIIKLNFVMSGGYHAYVTMLDNGFMVEAVEVDADAEAEYNIYSTERDDDSDDVDIDLTRSDAVVGMNLLSQIKRKRND